jgi:hypothetical protein
MFATTVPTGTGAQVTPVDPALLGSGANAQALPEETQGLTPEAAQALAEQLKQLQLEDDTKRRKALRAMFGQGFPLALEHQPTDNDWYAWVNERWENYRAGVSQNILWAERNRLFRAGQQNLSPYGSNGVWRPAPQPKDSVRIVDNRLRPALAWALEVIREQRPGWRFQPTSTDADRQDKAEAQQRAVEYQWNRQKKIDIDAETLYWAQTDGVAFQMTYWDTEEGPWEELEASRGPVPIGDVGTRVYRIEQVRVSSEATANIAPMLWLCRDIMPKAQAIGMFGPDIVDQADQQLLAQQVTQLSSVNQFAYTPLYQDQSTVARFTVFCERSQWLPEGLTVIVVGKKVTFGPKPLLMGRVPMIRCTDGSEDPQFYPVPKMNTLIPPQMRINQLWSKWYESIRKNAGGRYATKNGAVSAETLIGGEVSMLEVRTTGDIRESIVPIPGFTVGNDIKEALDREIKIIEDQTGYNDQARGQFASDQSGKAILAIREQLERTFAPLAGALASANTEWAKQQIGWMKFGYQMPRTIAVLGKNRADLGVSLSSVDMDGVVDITVDPESLVPQPKALKQWMLDNAFDRQLISKEQWLERSPIGDVRDMQSPDQLQYAKGKRLVEQIRLHQPLEPMIWQDDEAIQQNVLERDLLLAGGTPPDQMAAAQERWQQLAQQQQGKKAPPVPTKGSPEANYAEFIAQITTQAKIAAEAVIAQAIEAADLANAQAISAATMTALPTTAPVVPTAGNTTAKPRAGQPLDPRSAPVFSGGAAPSVPSAPGAFAAGTPNGVPIHA